MRLTPNFASKTKDLAFVSVLNWFATIFSVSRPCLSKHLPSLKVIGREKRKKKEKNEKGSKVG